MFSDVLDGEISVWDFSFDLGDWLTGDNGNKLITENETLFDYLNENVLEEMELLPDYEIETNRQLFTKFYNEAKKLAK